MTYSFQPEPEVISWQVGDSSAISRTVYKEWDYCPVIIDFQPAVLDSAGEEFNTIAYRLKISSPSSNRQGIKQTIKGSYFVDVPDDGPLILKLIPSGRYVPNGRYVVEYYAVGESTPVEVQHWVVPERPPLLQYTYSWDGNDVILPSDAYEIKNISPHYQFTYQYNTLLWNAAPPPIDQPLVITYQPAATLADIMVEKKPSF